MAIIKNSLYEFINNSKLGSAASRMPFSSAGVVVEYLDWLITQRKFSDSELSTITTLRGLIEIDFREIEGEESIQFDGTPSGAIDVFNKFDIPNGKFIPNYSDLRVGTLSIPTPNGIEVAYASDLIVKRGTKYYVEAQLENAA